jgi:hypothetical protein
LLIIRTITPSRKRVAMFGLVVSFVSYPFAVWGFKRLFENLGLETNTKFLVFLMASVVSWLAGTAAGHL